MPINPNGQNALPSFLTKWRTMQPFVNQFSPQAQQAVFGVDLKKLKAGQQTLSQNEALIGLRAAEDLNTHLPSQEEPGFLGLLKRVPGAAVHDAEQVLTNLPHLPGQIVKEAKAIPELPADIGQVHSLSDVARLPVVRDLPGSFTLANISHPSEFLKHPLMTALDLTPYTAEGVKLLPEAFRSEVSSRIANLGDKMGIGPVSEGTARILNVAKRQSLDAQQEIINRASALTEGLSDADKKTLQNALFAEPVNANVLNGQLQLPVTSGTGELPSHLMEKFNQLKGHQAELNELHRATRQLAVNQVADTYGTTMSKYLAEKAPEVEQLVQQFGVDPSDAVRSIYRREGLERYRPSTLVPGTKYEGEELLVPKAVNDVLHDVHDMRMKSGLGRANEQIMKVFRTAVIPLSLHWHMVHTTGATAMVLADAGPEALTKLGAAWQMVKSGGLPKEISQAGLIGGEHGLWSGPAQDPFLEIAQGKEIHQMLNSSAFDKYSSAVGKPLARVVEKSYRVSNIIDHMTGAVAYLTGHDKGLASGLTEAESHAAGIEAANRALHDWDAVTPVERRVVKSVFPFYPWMKTITKYLARYPGNHPLTTSIVTNFAKNEMADKNTGLPEQFDNYFNIGKPDAQGNQKSIYINRVNPFADVSSLFTLGGLMSQVNPLVGGITEALGLNHQTGASQAFPDVVYNPITGRQEAVHQNPISTIIRNFVPQETAITRGLSHTPFAFLSKESQSIKNLKVSNPETYSNMFWSSVGIPNLRTLNPPQLTASAEIQKFQALQSNVNQMIRDGDFDKLRSYGDNLVPFSGGGKIQLIPGNQLAQYLTQLQSLGKLDQLDTSKNGLQNLQQSRVFQSLGLGG